MKLFNWTSIIATIDCWLSLIAHSQMTQCFRHAALADYVAGGWVFWCQLFLRTGCSADASWEITVKFETLALETSD